MPHPYGDNLDSINTNPDQLSYLVDEIIKAASENNIARIRVMLEGTVKNVDRTRDQECISALMSASKRSSIDAVKLLTKTLGLEINTQDHEGRTAIFHASGTGNSQLCEYLIGEDADVNLTNLKGRTPLIVAASKGHAKLCAMLVDEGHANINHQDVTGTTALMYAAFKGYKACIQALVTRGADLDIIDKCGWTALMFSASSGHIESCRALISSGASKNIISNDGKTAEILAHEAGHYQVVDIILDQETISAAPPQAYRGTRRFNEGGSRVQDLVRHGSGFDNIVTQSLEQTSAGFTENSPPLSSAPSTSPLAPQSTPEKRIALTSKYRRQLNMPSIRHRLSWGGARLAQTRGEKPEVKPRSWWNFLVMALTFYILDSCLGKGTTEFKQARREKIALCLIIVIISGSMAFLVYGAAVVACRGSNTVNESKIYGTYGPNSTNGVYAMIVRGQLYNVGNYFAKPGVHGYSNNAPANANFTHFTNANLKPVTDLYVGKDISILFPVDPATSQCKYTPKPNVNTQSCGVGSDPKFYCHTSANSNQQLSQLSMGLWVSYGWDSIEKNQEGKKLLVYNRNVYDVTSYLTANNASLYLGEPANQIAIRNWISTLVGRDATLELSQSNDFDDLLPCFDEQFLLGKVEDISLGCAASDVLYIIQMMILIGSTSAKFISAIAFDWFQSRKFAKLTKVAKIPKPDDKESYVIILVTCYSEGEHSIRSTLDSLAQSDYSDKQKLLFVIADGDVTGMGNDRSTPDICKSLIELQDDEESDFLEYSSIGHGASQYNRAKVYSGYYKVDGHSVPMIFVHKCGSPQEVGQPKAGNRGKRDSQIILMNFLRRITFDRPMSPLDYEMFEKIRKLTGVTANQYNLVLMVDADTLVNSDALRHMVDVMEDDAEIMGLCGETKVANKTHSWITMIQVFDYYLSNHLGKAFESTFGRVTCLPGCFCMYRVKAPKYGGFMVPLLASPDIIQEYSSGQVDTLHRKNLLLLGEDRFLTALMLRTFPNRKIVYAPKAVCKTVVPDSFKVLLSQRRRWINSTVHNLLELLTAPQLCGIFCFSMQFIIFLDLLGTAILPSAFLILLYLVIAATALQQNVLMPLLFLLLTFGLQVGLVMFTTRNPKYVFWMIVYVLAIPVWNFILPLYAFWNFDDFSWGATRQINGSDTGHGGNSEDEKFIPPAVVLKKWNEWATEKRD